MRIDVISIFPEMIEQFASHSLLGRARRDGVFELRVLDLRSVATDPHRSVDDAPFGGGPGMVLAPEPIFDTVEQAGVARPLILLSAAGRRLDQPTVETLAAGDGLSLLCGRYEGVDERVRTALADDEISVGDYVLAGGEVAAMVVLEAVVRLLPGVMGNTDSGGDDSFSSGLLGHPQYTRPAEYRGMAVPEVLRSGDHGGVERWRRAQALARTQRQRPDLIAARGGLSEADLELLEEFDLLPEN
ncbi:MAG: tRNA (guanosine(37)-N1)-methyltransferase TrmD [Acidimicrobiia bacterium]|nr:tRNA (guanosine(37)-N1)-methyltransferase TrmD [Acidimicrobiia bacterium]MYC46645.1 tRNA (guanosine(37)-N1)-methyltransferase TrmD [Acidimicrobiia bacterium]MYI20328.1 tRNA (guanosine(37)-N1)-methyltransferase TrmD [Acidimicrobiia bacterium]